MIWGVGTDLCEVRRIEAALARHGLRFAQRILRPTELLTWQERQARCAARGVQFLATRFSAKESFSKALGLGLRAPMSWQAAEVVRAPSGQPGILAHGALAAWMAARGLRAHLSLSDDGAYAVSHCVLEVVQEIPALR